MIAPYGDSCSICTGKWHKTHLPVYREALVDLLQSRGRDLLPMKTLQKDVSISSLIWGDAYWTEKIFDRAFSGIKKSHVDALIFSLTAAGILAIKCVGGKESWVMVNVRDESKHEHEWQAKYAMDHAWTGINQFDPERPRKRSIVVSTKSSKNRTKKKQ